MSGRARVGVAAVGATVVALLVAGCGGGGDEDAGTPKVEVKGASESSANAHAGQHMLKARQSLSVPEITEQGTRGEILEAFWDYYQVRVQTQHKMDPVLAEYSSVMVGDALTRYSQSIAKYNRRGWKLYGAPEITDVEVLSYRPDMNPPQAVVGACIDDGNWRASGKRPASRPAGPGADYTRAGISKEQGEWRVYGLAQESRDQGRC